MDKFIENHPYLTVLIVYIICAALVDIIRSNCTCQTENGNVKAKRSREALFKIELGNGGKRDDDKKRE